MKILLLIIPLLFGCAREYCCYPEEIESIEKGCGGFNYTVDWPDGEKEAEEQCEEELVGAGHLASKPTSPILPS